MTTTLTKMSSGSHINLMRTIFPQRVNKRRSSTILRTNMNTTSHIINTIRNINNNSLILGSLLYRKRNTPRTRIKIVLQIPRQIRATSNINRQILLTNIIIRVRQLSRIFIRRTNLVLTRGLYTRRPPRRTRHNMKRTIKTTLPQLKIIIRRTTTSIMSSTIRIIQRGRTPHRLGIETRSLWGNNKGGVIHVRFSTINGTFYESFRDVLLTWVCNIPQ